MPTTVFLTNSCLMYFVDLNGRVDGILYVLSSMSYCVFKRLGVTVTLSVWTVSCTLFGVCCVQN